VAEKNNQFPSTNNQIITKSPMTEILGFEHLDFGNWNLFGAWKLGFQCYALCEFSSALIY
jgi:hypothetical protein